VLQWGSKEGAAGGGTAPAVRQAAVAWGAVPAVAEASCSSWGGEEGSLPLAAMHQPRAVPLAAWVGGSSAGWGCSRARERQPAAIIVNTMMAAARPAAAACGMAAGRGQGGALAGWLAQWPC